MWMLENMQWNVTFSDSQGGGLRITQARFHMDGFDSSGLVIISFFHTEGGEQETVTTHSCALKTLTPWRVCTGYV